MIWPSIPVRPGSDGELVREHLASAGARNRCGVYAEGTIGTADVFHDEDSFSRTVTATTSAALAGAYEGAATWDQDTEMLTVVRTDETFSLALPEGVDIRFGASVAELSTGGGSSEPLAGSGAWAVAARRLRHRVDRTRVRRQ